MNPISDKNKGFDLLHKAWMKVDSKNFCLHLFGINNVDEAIYCKNIIPDAATSFGKIIYMQRHMVPLI